MKIKKRCDHSYGGWYLDHRSYPVRICRKCGVIQQKKDFIPSSPGRIFKSKTDHICLWGY